MLNGFTITALSGTNVEFYSSSDPGPLGKPEIKKIAGYSSPLRNWDPTDPDENNPWHYTDSNYVPPYNPPAQDPVQPSNPHDIVITIP